MDQGYPAPYFDDLPRLSCQETPLRPMIAFLTSYYPIHVHDNSSRVSARFYAIKSIEHTHRNELSVGSGLSVLFLVPVLGQPRYPDRSLKCLYTVKFQKWDRTFRRKRTNRNSPLAGDVGLLNPSSCIDQIQRSYNLVSYPWNGSLKITQFLL